MKDFFSTVWYRLCDAFRNWVYPAYCWRYLRHRYDLVRLPGLKPYEYADARERMKIAVFELVCEFVDTGERQQIVEWYGESGPKVDGEYVFDAAKQIRQWWRVSRPAAQRQFDGFFSFYATWCMGKLVFNDKNGNSLVRFDKSGLPKTLEAAKAMIPEAEWKQFDAGCADREKMFDEHFMLGRQNELETAIYESDQKMLHKAIAIRTHLWT